MTKIIRWLIKKFLPGYHLVKNPVKGAGRKKREAKIQESGDEILAAIKQAPRLTGYDIDPKARMILREAETCPRCKAVYLSLYPVRTCADHEGLEQI